MFSTVKAEMTPFINAGEVLGFEGGGLEGSKGVEHEHEISTCVCQAALRRNGTAGHRGRVL